MINQEMLVCALPGDVLVLTKPLGTSIALDAKDSLTDPAKKERLMVIFEEGELEEIFEYTQKSIDRSNVTAMNLLPKYDVHAVTQISRLGLLKDAENLVQTQSENVDFIIHNLPVISKVKGIFFAFENTEPIVRLRNGLSPEINGGLLIAMLKEDAVSFSMDLVRAEGCASYIIGEVVEGTRTAKVVDEAVTLEVWR